MNIDARLNKLEEKTGGHLPKPPTWLEVSYYETDNKTGEQVEKTMGKIDFAGRGKRENG
jgi:hypothetical protein